ncbi:hypothetical protein JW964_17850 [candidate division KSB1 bacterium]|nr:hypothetical protein [candidate division KSB1 bacterium]
MKAAIFQNRKSVRRYSSTGINEATLKQLLDFSEKLPSFFAPIKQQFIWVHGKDWIADTLSKFLLTYGKIISAPYMLVPFFENGLTAPIEIGYHAEHIVLKATELELGTLWVSTEDGTDFIKEAIINAIKEKNDSLPVKFLNKIPGNIDTVIKDMQLPAVVLIGHPSDKRLDRIINNAVRMESAGNSRKKLEAVLTTNRQDQLPEKLRKIFNLALLAPSQKNQQPWRIRMTNQGFDVGFLHERQLDFGIFLAHIKIALDDFNIQYRTEKIDEKVNDVEWNTRIVLS